VVLVVLFVSFAIADLIGYWPLNEGTGQASLDVSGSQNHAIFTPIGSKGQLVSTGLIAGGLKASGNVCGWIYNTLINEFTISFWLKGSTPGPTSPLNEWYNGAGLVDGEVPGAANDFGVSLLGNNIAFGTGPTDSSIISTVAVTDNVWHHIVASRSLTYDGVSNSSTLRLYIDGVVNNQAALGPGVNVQPRITPNLAFGCLATNIQDFTGLLDEIRIYSSVLTTTQIADLYTYEKSGFTTNPPPTSAPSTANPTVSPTTASRFSSNTASGGTASRGSTNPQQPSSGVIGTPNIVASNTKASQSTVIALSVVGSVVGAALIGIAIYVIIINKNKSYEAGKDRAEALERELEEKAKKEAQNI